MRQETSWWRIGCLVLGIVFSAAAHAAELRYSQPQGRGPYPIPRIKQLVNDYTGVLTLKEAALLEKKLDRLERRNGTQIVLLILLTTGDESMFDYSLRAFQTWDLGHNGQGNGVLFIVALNGQWRISTGSGIQGALPDALVRRVLQENIAPLWEQATDWLDHERVYRALDTSLEVLVSHAQHERTSPPNYSFYDEIPRELYGLAILVVGMFTAFGLWRLFRKHRVPKQWQAIGYLSVSVVTGVGAYYLSLHTTLLEDLMVPLPNRAATPAIIQIEAPPSAEDSDFNVGNLAEARVFTVVHFGSRTCPACKFLDTNLKDFLELRPDVVVKRIELGTPLNLYAASKLYHLQIHVVPHIQIYDPHTRLVATDKLLDGEAFELLYDWMEAEQRRAAGLQRRQFPQGAP